MEKFSVLMSLYSKENPKYLNSALDSLFTQTYQPTEVIMVFDGEVSSSLASVVSSWKTKLNIIILELPNNVGLSSALNHGLEVCNYDLVARFDTDDICLKNRFSEQVEFMANNPSVDICGGFAKFIDSSGREYSERRLPLEHSNIQRLIWSCPIIHPSVMFRKARIISIGSYNKEAPHRQDDYELWIRAMDSGLTFHNINSFLIQYRYNVDDFKKNTFRVGLYRFLIGFKPWWKYDKRASSFVGLLFPLLRASLPLKLALGLTSFANRFDPRKKV